MKNLDKNDIFNKIEVIFENENFLIINKPANLLVHPISDKFQEETLIDWLLKYYPEIKKIGPPNRWGIVHRLDKDVSGLLIVAKTEKYFNHFKNEFANKRVEKRYLALVYSQPKSESGIITLPFTRGKNGKIILAKKAPLEKIKETWTEYKVVKKFKNFSLLEVKTKTGRTHQIRIHLRSIGHPIVGDKKYLIKPFRHLAVNQLNRIFLHAYKLGFYDLEGRWLEFKIDLPEELNSFLKNLN